MLFPLQIDLHKANVSHRVDSQMAQGTGRKGVSSKMSLTSSVLEKQRRSMMFSSSVVAYLNVAWWFNEVLCAFFKWEVVPFLLFYNFPGSPSLWSLLC